MRKIKIIFIFILTLLSVNIYSSNLNNLGYDFTLDYMMPESCVLSFTAKDPKIDIADFKSFNKKLSIPEDPVDAVLKYDIYAESYSIPEFYINYLIRTENTYDLYLGGTAFKSDGEDFNDVTKYMDYVLTVQGSIETELVYDSSTPVDPEPILLATITPLEKDKYVSAGTYPASVVTGNLPRGTLAGELFKAVFTLSIQIQ